MTLVLSGTQYASVVRESLRERVSLLEGPPPGLTVVMVGDDPASSVYVAAKEKACSKVGFVSRLVKLRAEATEEEVLEVLHGLNSDDTVHGILVQLPVPAHISVHRIASAVLPEKDVDGFHPMNVGRLWRGEQGLFPCTPSGIVGILHHHGIQLTGKTAVIAGRSNIVGKPMAALLLRENCTVTLVHSFTENIEEQCKRADILIAAVGIPELITQSFLKPGVVVVDVGMNRDRDGNLVGDVAYQDVFDICSAITPVPGGVGPLTIAYLLENTFKARVSSRITL
jgi:methylenetetrahydrofolate dehydrogenase (NADP+)/methenyltetrahydrofolate cyclohydrolase